MRHCIYSMPTAFMQTICVAGLLFLCVPIAHSDTNEPPTNSHSVAAETGSDGVQRLEIILDSYSFTPADIIVQSGKPVELRLKNVAAVTPHNFTLEAPAAGLHVHKDVAAGETETLTFLPDAPGRYEFYCDKKLPFFPSHKEKGMVGKLEAR